MTQATTFAELKEGQASCRRKSRRDEVKNEREQNVRGAKVEGWVMYWVSLTSLFQ